MWAWGGWGGSCNLNLRYFLVRRETRREEREREREKEREIQGHVCHSSYIDIVRPITLREERSRI